MLVIAKLTWKSFNSEASRTSSLLASFSLNIRLNAAAQDGLKHCANFKKEF